MPSQRGQPGTIATISFQTYAGPFSGLPLQLSEGLSCMIPSNAFPTVTSGRPQRASCVTYSGDASLEMVAFEMAFACGPWR